MKSKSHQKLKQKENENAGKLKQLTLTETLVKEMEKTRNSAIYDFVYALVLSAEPICKANGP